MGGSVDFSAAAASAAVSTTAVVTGPPFSVAFWGKPSVEGGSSFAISEDFTSLNDSHWIGHSNASGRHEANSRVAATVSSGFPSGGAVTLDAWNHFGGVWAATDSRSCYLHGGNKSTGTDDVNPTDITNTTIGNRASQGNNYLGQIAYLAIWNIALSDANMASLAGGANPLTIEPANLVALYDGTTYTDGADEYMEDSVGTNDLLLQNGAVWVDDSPTVDGVVPQGTVTIDSVTPGETTATFTYSYDSDDETGFKYRLDGGTAVDIDDPDPKSHEITGLTAGTTYDLEVLAYNAEGDGEWSTVEEFTTDEAATGGVILFRRRHD